MGPCPELLFDVMRVTPYDSLANVVLHQVACFCGPSAEGWPSG